MALLDNTGLAYLWSKLKAYIDGLQVGGRNLLLRTQSSAPSEMAFTHATSGVVESLTDGSYGVLRANGTGAAYMAWFYATSIKAVVDADITVQTDLTAGEYVFAFDLKTNITGASLPANIQFRLFRYENGLYTNFATIFTAQLKSYPACVGSETWYRAEYHINIPEEIGWSISSSLTSGENYIVAVGFVTKSSFAAGQYFQVRRAKLERGTAATDWTPAPEDKADAPAFVSGTLTAAGWADNSETDTKAAYPKTYALAVSGAAAGDGAECVIAPASMAEAAACGMCPSVEVTAGYVNFYAQKAPAAAIAVQIRLIR